LTLLDRAATFDATITSTGRTAMVHRHDRRFNDAREAAGNGLLDRRAFLTGSAGALATGAFMAYAPSEAGAAGPPETPMEMKVSGARQAHQGDGHADHDEGRDVEVHRSPGGW
jgi:hypothetical protein